MSLGARLASATMKGACLMTTRVGLSRMDVASDRKSGRYVFNIAPHAEQGMTWFQNACRILTLIGYARCCMVVGALDSGRKFWGIGVF